VSYVCREFDAAPADVFAVLIDPDSYPDWLVGAKSIRGVDASWPEPGSRFHHRVGVGALTISDCTEILAVEPGSMLQLRVRARPLIAAVVTFRVIGDRERCVVVMEEEPARRAIGNLVRPVMDPLIHVRNHRSLHRLGEFVAQHVPSTRVGTQNA
jgi:uncharacterized protein YndB with AHSA1/START domain